MHRISNFGFQKVGSISKGEIPSVKFMNEENSVIGSIQIKDGVFTFEGNQAESAAEFIKYLTGGLTGWLLENELRVRCDALAARLAELEGQEPLFWYRPCCGGEMYEGPVHNNSVGGKLLRDEKPDEWRGLYARQVPAEPAGTSLLEVMDAVRQHGATLTNAEILEQMDIKKSVPEQLHEPLVTIEGEVFTVGLSSAQDINPLIGSPSVTIQRTDGSSVLVLGLTEEECRAGALAFMDSAVLTLSAIAKTEPLTSGD